MKWLVRRLGSRRRLVFALFALSAVILFFMEISKVITENGHQSYNRLARFYSQSVPVQIYHPFVLAPLANPQLTPQQKKCGYFRKDYLRRKVVHPFLYGQNRSQLDPLDVTLYTQLSLSRVNSLLRAARYWPGPISAAVGGKWQELENFRSILQNSELLRQRDNVWIHGLEHNMTVYPIDLLRNVALNYTGTEYVFLIDVDNVPKMNTHERLRGLVSKLSKEDKIAYIIPLMESDADNFTVPQTKTELHVHWDKNEIRPFHIQRAPTAHKPMDFPRWWKTEDFYTVKYPWGFEPFVCAPKSHIPWFNSAVLGRVHDKVSHVWAMNYTGFEFVVIPDVYMVHIHHPLWKTTRQDDTCGKEVWRLYSEWAKQLSPEELAHKKPFDI